MICVRCGFQSVYVFEQCPNCADPVTVIEEPIDDDEAPIQLSAWEADPVESIITHTPFDAITGNGMPCGASILVSGPAGCGKSSWALRIASAWAGKSWYFPYERGIDALRRDADRLQVDVQRIWVCSPVASPFKFFGAGGLLIIDSLNDYASRYDGLIAAVRTLAAHATNTQTSVLMLAHVTKDWDVAGPERMKHDVDVHIEMVPLLDGESTPVRQMTLIRCDQKNRFGPLWRATVPPAWIIP